MTMLLQICERIDAQPHCDDELILPFDLRKKSRVRVRLQSGIEAALQLPRGSILRGGDYLLSGDGRAIKVIAANEPIMRVSAENAVQLMRAVYHLANRHVPLQIGCDSARAGEQSSKGWLQLERDHVLKEMLIGLGMTVNEISAPFEPEAGAYGGGHHHHHEQ